jgi:hypothetical protein
MVRRFKGSSLRRSQIRNGGLMLIGTGLLLLGLVTGILLIGTGKPTNSTACFWGRSADRWLCSTCQGKFQSTRSQLN